MKYFLAAICFAGLLATARAQTPPDNGNANPAPDQVAPETPPAASPPEAGGAQTAAPDAAPSPEALAAAVAAVESAAAASKPAESTAILPTEALGSSHAAVNSDFTPPLTGTNANALLMNFRNAPLDMVLNYLSDAAGFIIVLDTQVRGNVSVISSHPMTQDEAVDLLNSVLNKNGYAAIRDGRTLTIVNKDDAKTRNIPVKVESDPKKIPKNDEIVTQIIPIRFVEAEQLTKDLSPFVSSQATIVANSAGNSIVITDTQSNIRHLAEIIQAIDNSAEAETEIRVFHLKYANPADVATELGNIFPSGSSGNTTQAPTRFGGGFGGGGGGGGFLARMMGGGGGQAAAGGSSSNDRIKKATQVTAVADARIQSVIVSGPKDLMEEIAGMMKDLDVPSARDQKVYVFHMNNGDPQQAAQVLQTMFQSSSSSRSGSSSSSTTSPLMQRVQNNSTTTSSSSSGTSGFGGSTGGGGGGGAGRAF